MYDKYSKISFYYKTQDIKVNFVQIFLYIFRYDESRWVSGFLLFNGAHISAIVLFIIYSYKHLYKIIMSLQTWKENMFIRSFVYIVINS